MNATKIVRLVAIVVALAAGIFAIPEEALVLVIVGLVLGVMTVPGENRMMYLITAATLSIVSGSLGPIPAIGSYLTDILGATSALLNAGAVAVIVMHIKDRAME